LTNTIVTALQQRFQNPYLQNLYRLQLSKRRRRDNESLLQMGEDMKRVARLAYPEMPEDIRDQMARDYFIKALDDMDMKWKVRQCRPRTMVEAICHATELDSFLKMERRESNKPGKFNKMVRTISHEEHPGRDLPEDPGMEPYSEENSSEDEDLDQLMGDFVREVKKQWKYGKKKFHNRSSGKGCFKCGQEGHWQRECPKVTKKVSEDGTTPVASTSQSSSGN